MEEPNPKLKAIAGERAETPDFDVQTPPETETHAAEPTTTPGTSTTGIIQTPIDTTTTAVPRTAQDF